MYILFKSRGGDQVPQRLEPKEGSERGQIHGKVEEGLEGQKQSFRWDDGKSITDVASK